MMLNTVVMKRDNMPGWRSVGGTMGRQEKRNWFSVFGLPTLGKKCHENFRDKCKVSGRCGIACGSGGTIYKMG